MFMAEKNLKERVSCCLPDLAELSHEDMQGILSEPPRSGFGGSIFKYLAEDTPEARADLIHRLYCFSMRDLRQGAKEAGLTVQSTGQKERVQDPETGTFYEREQVIVTTSTGEHITPEEAFKLVPCSIPGCGPRRDPNKKYVSLAGWDNC